MNKTKLKTRKYNSYEEYTNHQKSKLLRINGGFYNKLKMKLYDEKYKYVLQKRLEEQNIVKPHMNVLCLAARLGTEVKSFISMGCFAVGLDLNVGTNNKYVVYGDFHNIQFASNSVDVVFLNSIDHSLNLSKLLKEIRRVLKPNGRFILEVSHGTLEGYTPTDYEVIVWEKVDDLLNILVKEGFEILKKTEFKNPWKGVQVSMSVYK